jgi:hypothetical protein
VQGTITIDATPLYVAEAKKEQVSLAEATLATFLKLAPAAEVYRITGAALRAGTEGWK